MGVAIAADRREAIAGLRLRLAGVLDRGCSGSAALPTGVSALDALLPGGGIPRGRLTELLGERGSGRTTIVRQLALQAVAAGHRVACVDASRTLAPRDWAVPDANGGARDGMWIVRPPDAARGAWCADVLLRTGAFALVVLDGVPELERAVAVRLMRLAREHDTALVLLGATAAGSQLGGALRLRFEAAELNARATATARATRIVVEKGGPRKTVEVNRAIPMARRLCTHPEVPDRRRPAAGRGGARAGGGGAAGAPAGGRGGGGRRQVASGTPERRSGGRRTVGRRSA